MLKRIMNIGLRRMTWMIIGNVLLGLGVCVFKLSGMGNDPFSAMVMSVSTLLHLPFSSFLILLNTLIFIIEITMGRKYIGPGTFVNWFLIGYAAQFFIWLSATCITPPEAFFGRLPYVIAGVIITSLGVSLYQTSDAGIAPYDCVSLIMDEHLPLPYFWCRMICDAASALVCLLTGGLIGLGTFLCAVGLGPVIHFFNINVSKKLLYKKSAA
jgi:uncharacterized membrane protein YczE